MVKATKAPKAPKKEVYKLGDAILYKLRGQSAPSRGIITAQFLTEYNGTKINAMYEFQVRQLTADGNLLGSQSVRTTEIFGRLKIIKAYCFQCNKTDEYVWYSSEDESDKDFTRKPEFDMSRPQS